MGISFITINKYKGEQFIISRLSMQFMTIFPVDLFYLVSINSTVDRKKLRQFIPGKPLYYSIPS